MPNPFDVEGLSEDQHYNILARVAGDQATPPEILDQLIQGDVEDVYHFIAANRNASGEILHYLFSWALNNRDSIYCLSVFNSLAGNPASSDELLLGIYRRGGATAQTIAKNRLELRGLKVE